MLEESEKPTIYVTSNWYTRFSNYVEGTFSTIPRDGIFLVENGKIARPIRKIRISENIVDLVGRISWIGEDVTQVHWWEVGTPTFIPHIKFDDVKVTAATM
jgi:PmbA protein